MPEWINFAPVFEASLDAAIRHVDSSMRHHPGRTPIYFPPRVFLRFRDGDGVPALRVTNV